MNRFGTIHIMKRMLVVFAHPDDESFASAGTIAKYVKAGWKVDLICATRGEAGSTGPYGEKTTGQLGSIRQGELEKAGKLLGISSITLLGYMDGELNTQPSGELEDKIYRKMEELVPDCVITFDTTGISNHPDHVKICYATTYAFQKYAFWIDKQLKQEPGYNEEDAPKLYYACIPETVIDYLQRKKVFSEISFEKPWVGTPDKFVTTAISIAGFQLMKKKALRLHVSQEEDVERFVSLPKNPLISQEYYIFRLHGTREIFMGKNDRVASKL
jgi:N-acetylglucosamine malate deacetylase 2